MAAYSGGGGGAPGREACDAAWLGFPSWEGTHWSVRRFENRWLLVARDSGQMLAVINEHQNKPRWMGLGAGVHEVRVPGGPVYRTGSERLLRAERYLVDAFSDAPVAHVAGTHFDHQANATVRVLGAPGPAGGDTLVFRFPVMSTSYRNAVMIAVDNAGTPVLWFRRVRAVERSPHWGSASGYGFDIVVRAGMVRAGTQPSPTLILVAAVASPWVSSYFRTSLS